MGLRLGVNEIYRGAIEAAQQLTGIDGSAIAALIDAEAAKISSGPNRGRWNRESHNAGSGASGLTQFLASTWIDHALRPAHLLNSRAKGLGYVTAANKVVSGQRQALLALRFDADLSIISAAEYGVDNLKILAHAGALPATMSDDQRARYMYLAHHEGAGGATGYLKGTRSYTRQNLVGQVGANAADRYIDACGGSTSAAYRMWLEAYMDEKIVPAKFRDGGSSAATAVVAGSPQGSATVPAGELLPPGRAYVSTEGLNLRRSPNGQVLRALTLGEAVTVGARIGDTRWYEVTVDGTQGVASGAYLRRPLPAARERLFARTIEEWVRFEKGAGSEELEPFNTYVHQMWRAIGLDWYGRSKYPGTQEDVPWSAAFISWVVRRAGGEYARFAFDQAHSRYTNDAIRARVTEETGKPFWGYRPTEERPAIGDIIVRNRAGGSLTYDHAENHSGFKSHGDIVVEVRGRVARVIGGNTGGGEGSVSLGDYDLDDNGYLRPGQRVIALLKNRSDAV